MVICPKCNAENRPEAAFCARCGTILISQAVPAKPIDQPAPQKSTDQPTPSASSDRSVIALPASQAAPVEPIDKGMFFPGFSKRPEGSIFNDRFQYDSLTYQDEHEIQYTVTEIERPGVPSVRVCSNLDCRAIHNPIGSETEKFCTQCGHALEERSLLFVLKEADNDKFQNIQPLLDLHLVHTNVHPPSDVFQQELLGGTRYCMVSPYSQELPPQPKIAQVLDWGIQLSQALDYLQSKGVALGDELDPSILGMADGKVVWREFKSSRVLPMLTDREKINNLRILALAMYSWITGKTTYSLDPYLPPLLNDLFQKALVGDGFTSGAEFELQLSLAKSAGAARLTLDHQVGRRTHIGKIRTINEDSVLSIELCRINEDSILPISLIAVADGMGGHASGEVASCLVTEAIAEIGGFEMVSLLNPSKEETGDWVRKAMEAANQSVYEARQTAGNDMGSTLVLGLIIGSQAYLGHLGDSRIYMISKGSVQQLTTDHSLVQHLVSIGKISPDEARFHPQRNVIYRSLGENTEIEADYFNLQLFPGDRLLFCSDGLSNLLDEQKIQKIVEESASPQAACDVMVEEANSAGGEDNISAVLLEVLAY